jgi:putative component of membrane protein insertase Oxa1/YidC/SpoIIIJ protein YidD
MKRIVLLMIRFYQRFLSPIKGYSCAYRVYTGQDSCSAYGYKVIDRYGVLVGYQLLKRRTQVCGEIMRSDETHHHSKRYMGKHQSGHCDAPNCDLPDLSTACDVGNTLANACASSSNCASSGSCDFSRKDTSKPMKFKPLPKKI